MIDSGRGTTRAEDAQGTPTQSQISPSILVYEPAKVDSGQDSLKITQKWPICGTDLRRKDVHSVGCGRGTFDNSVTSPAKSFPARFPV